MDVRLKYERGKEVVFISHLDLMRAFSRAFRRARIPIAYTKGFNPHAIMVFGLPLQVGVTSESEYLDISLDVSPSPISDAPPDVSPNPINDALLDVSPNPIDDASLDVSPSPISDAPCVALHDTLNDASEVVSSDDARLVSCDKTDVASVGDLMYFCTDKLIEDLNAQLPVGLKILEAKIKKDSGNIMSQITHAAYIVTISATQDECLSSDGKRRASQDNPSVSPDESRLASDESLAAPRELCKASLIEETVAKVNDFLASENVLVKKITKKGSRDINVRPLVKVLEIVETKQMDRVFQLKMILSAGSKDNLKPGLLLDSLGIKDLFPSMKTSVHRIGLFIDQNGELTAP